MHVAHNRLWIVLIDKAIFVSSCPGDSIAETCELVTGMSMKESVH